MFNALITGVFGVVESLAGSIMVAPITLITALFPNLTYAINQVIDYFTTILQFVPLALDFLMVPREAVVFLFDYYIIKYSIYLIVRAIKLILAIYNKLKP